MTQAQLIAATLPTWANWLVEIEADTQEDPRGMLAAGPELSDLLDAISFGTSDDGRYLRPFIAAWVANPPHKVGEANILHIGDYVVRVIRIREEG